MLSQKTALGFQDVVAKLKKAPLEAYTTPAGALGGVLLTKMLKRKPELRHYLAGGALGAAAGYGGGVMGRHYLEGYKKTPAHDPKLVDDAIAPKQPVEDRAAEAAATPLPVTPEIDQSPVDLLDDTAPPEATAAVTTAKNKVDPTRLSLGDAPMPARQEQLAAQSRQQEDTMKLLKQEQLVQQNLSADDQKNYAEMKKLLEGGYPDARKAMDAIGKKALAAQVATTQRKSDVDTDVQARRDAETGNRVMAGSTTADDVTRENLRRQQAEAQNAADKIRAALERAGR